jgi:hypothetical protein
MDNPIAPPNTNSKPPQKTTGFFGGSKKTEATNQTQEIVLQLNDVSRRLLILEERYANLRKKTQLTDQNMLENNRAYNQQLSRMREQLSQFSNDLKNINDKIKIIIRELTECAKKQDVDILTKYIDMWNPVNFVSRDEVYKLIKDQVETTMTDLNLKIQQEEFIKEQVELAVKKYLSEKTK